MSLERALSKLGAASRSQARDAIRSGRVVVDGLRATDPLAPVVPERATIVLDGRPVMPPEALTIVLNKPRGVLTTRTDPRGRPTVYDLLAGVAPRLVAVGRLDLATSGLLLLTSDTRLADWLTDPAHAVLRVYAATVRGALADDAVRHLVTGIVDGRETLAARAVRVRKRSRRETHLIVELTGGRNREVRRMMAAVGHEVTRLMRVAFGGLVLGALPTGCWRALSSEELSAAFPGAPIRAGRPGMEPVGPGGSMC